MFLTFQEEIIDCISTSVPLFVVVNLSEMFNQRLLVGFASSLSEVGKARF